MISRFVFVFPVLLLFTWLDVTPLYAERWVDVTGQTTINADFIGMWSGSVVLQKSDGTRLVIPLAKFDADSRLKAQDYEKQRAVSSAKRLVEIREAAKLADNTKPIDVKKKYVPLADTATIQEVLDHVREQLKSGHIEVFWDLLPKSYQDDVNGLVKLGASKIEPAQWNAMTQLIDKLERLLKEKREFILNHPAMAFIDANSGDLPLSASYDAQVGLFTELLDPKALQLENLKSRELGTIIYEKAPAIGGYLLRLQEIAKQSNAPGIDQNMSKFFGEQTSEKAGTLTINNPNGEQRLEMVRFEGRWLPEKVVASWKSKVEELRGKISTWGPGQASPLAGVSLITIMAGGMIDQLLAAKTQADFNQAIMALVGQIPPEMLQQIGGVPPGQPGQPPPGAPPSGSPGGSSGLDNY
jgi:hypothetical protein